MHATTRTPEDLCLPPAMKCEKDSLMYKGQHLVSVRNATRLNAADIFPSYHISTIHFEDVSCSVNEPVDGL